MGVEYLDWLQDALVRCMVSAWLAVLQALGCGSGGAAEAESDEDELEEESVMLRPLISTARRPSVSEKLTMSPVEKMREWRAERTASAVAKLSAKLIFII